METYYYNINLKDVKMNKKWVGSYLSECNKTTMTFESILFLPWRYITSNSKLLIPKTCYSNTLFSRIKISNIDIMLVISAFNNKETQDMFRVVDKLGGRHL